MTTRTVCLIPLAFPFCASLPIESLGSLIEDSTLRGPSDFPSAYVYVVEFILFLLHFEKRWFRSNPVQIEKHLTIELRLSIYLN
jgi:hypothetical protein